MQAVKSCNQSEYSTIVLIKYSKCNVRSEFLKFVEES
jgi:hypothetical protein